ncbi:MAG TPA: amidohydrolase family protein [Bacillota bacterium]|nr:amidohydrolase family protein [Bacillota bacterium]
MKKWSLLLLFILWGGINMFENAAGLPSQVNLYAVTNVSVIPMDREQILSNQSVVITNDAISEIGPSGEIQIPAGAKIIDGSGKFLLPGLIDMHTHICDANDLPLLLAQGVTTIRNMGDLPGWVKFFFGYADILKLRRKVLNGEMLGPDIYTAGPILDGAPPVSPFNSVVINAEEAEQAVARQKKRGYDLIKIYDGLSPDTLNGIIKAAKKYQMPVAGHVPKQIPLNQVLDTGLISIEHLTGYLDNDRAAFIIPEDQLDQYAEKTKVSGVWNCPTLVIWDHLVPRKEFVKITNLPQMQYVSWRVEWLWKQTLKQVFKVNYNTADYPRQMMELSQKMTAALHHAGFLGRIPILWGFSPAGRPKGSWNFW